MSLAIDTIAAVAPVAEQQLTRQMDAYDPGSLVRQATVARDYPLDALGPVLGPAARAIVDATQCAPATAGNAVLAAGALATQAHADVRLPHSELAPLSLYIVTICESGERKSSADRLALAPVREEEARLREAFKPAFAAFANARDAYDAQRSKMVAKAKDYPSRLQALESLGPAPTVPLAPFRLVPETTAEGLIKAWPDAHGSLGLFMDEGGQFLGGHSMGREHRLKTITLLSRLWDGSGAGRLRAGDGHSAVCGRRLSCHLMLQPGVATDLFGDESIWDQGLLARILPGAPESRAGKRSYRAPNPSELAFLEDYNERLVELLSKPPVTIDGRNELAPRPISLSPEAERVWITFHDGIDQQCGPGGRLCDLRGFAAKAPAQAARVAGVLTILADTDAAAIEGETMQRAVLLMDFYLSEALRLRRTAVIDERVAKAELLREWLAAWPEPFISASDIAHTGPNSIRDVETVRALLSILEAHGVVEKSGAQVVQGKQRRETWRVLSPGNPSRVAN